MSDKVRVWDAADSLNDTDNDEELSEKRATKV